MLRNSVSYPCHPWPQVAQAPATLFFMRLKAHMANRSPSPGQPSRAHYRRRSQIQVRAGYHPNTRLVSLGRIAARCLYYDSPRFMVPELSWVEVLATIDYVVGSIA